MFSGLFAAVAVLVASPAFCEMRVSTPIGSTLTQLDGRADEWDDRASYGLRGDPEADPTLGVAHDSEKSVQHV